MEEQQARWSQGSLRAAEGGCRVAESLLLGPPSRTQLTKQGHFEQFSGVVPAQPQCPGSAQRWRDLSGDCLGATRRVPMVEAEVREGIHTAAASPLRCAGQRAPVLQAAAVAVKHKQG